jgi:hypothetical protein
VRLLCFVNARWLVLFGGCESDAQNGSTVMMIASENGRADCVRLLIDVGADKEAKDDVRVGRFFVEAPSYFLAPCCIFICNFVLFSIYLTVLST